MPTKSKTRTHSGTHKNKYNWKVGDIVKIPGGQIAYKIKADVSSDTWLMTQYPQERYLDLIPKEVEKITGNGAWTKEN